MRASDGMEAGVHLPQVEFAGEGAGSSRSDYDALGAGFESRWQRFDEAVTLLRALLGGAEPPAGGRHFAVPEARLLPVPRPAGRPRLIYGRRSEESEEGKPARAVEWLGRSPGKRRPARDGSFLAAIRRIAEAHSVQVSDG